MLACRFPFGGSEINMAGFAASGIASDSGSRFCPEWSADSVGRIWRSTDVRTFFEDREGWPQITHIRSCSGAEALTPKDGLFLFGPVDSNQNSARMDVGVIATAAGPQKYSKWVGFDREVHRRFPAQSEAKEKTMPTRLWPGFEAVATIPAAFVARANVGSCCFRSRTRASAPVTSNVTSCCGLLKCRDDQRRRN
jgi:hypothetical protein